MDSNLYISALQRQPCLLKTNSTRVLVTWLVTLLLIICPSSYKARLNNLIGTADIEPQIISPQWRNARPNFPTKKCVGGAKFGLVSRLDFSCFPCRFAPLYRHCFNTFPLCHFTLLHITSFLNVFVLVSLYVWMTWVITNIWCSLHFMSIAPLEIYLLRKMVTCSMLIIPAVCS